MTRTAIQRRLYYVPGRAHQDRKYALYEVLRSYSAFVAADPIGTSTFPASEIVEAQWVAEKRGFERFRTEQPPYSIVNRVIEREVLPVAQRYGMGTLVWSPLARACSPAGSAKATRTRPTGRA
jgi:aryl-alcohol dehydrogenase-like predicted oxidoreductase